MPSTTLSDVTETSFITAVLTRVVPSRIGGRQREHREGPNRWKLLGSAWRWVCRGVWRWLDWFKSLPAIQASIVLTILLVPILYFSPGWVERIIELYNEVKGK